MRGKWALVSAAVVVAAGAGIFALKHRQKPVPPPRQAEAAVIAGEEVTLNGLIRPQHVIGIGAAVPGNIDAFLADVGEDVFEGQLLARIGSSNVESEREAATQLVERSQDQVSKAEAAVNSARLEVSRADADMQRAQAQVDGAQKIHERQSTLYRAGATPKQVYEKSEKDYEAAVAEYDIMSKALRGARENLTVATSRVTEMRNLLAQRSRELESMEGQYAANEIHAPADGVIVGRKGEIGKPADEAGDQLFQIATDIYALEVPLEAKADLLKRIHTGQPVTVMVLDLQGMGLPGVVKEIHEKEGEIVVEFASTIPAIRPGMRADVRFKLE